WPDGNFAGDEDLAARLAAAVAEREPESLVFADLGGGHARKSAPLGEVDLVDLALSLEGGAVDARLFDEGERRSEAGCGSHAFELSLARALSRRGHVGRALAVLERSATPEA